MGSSFLSTTVGVISSPRRTCFISLPQDLVSNVVPCSVHVFSITTKSGRQCLVSWAGESHVTESFSKPSIVISDKLLSMNGFSLEEIECVILKQIPTPSPCERAHVTVSTTNDWENLILNSDVVQLEFLEQVRLVFPGLKLPLWLEGGTCVEMTVLRITPATVCGLLLPLTYIEAVPPADVGTSTEARRKHHSLKFNPEHPAQVEQTLPVYETCTTKTKSIKEKCADSALTLLTESVLCNLCIVNQFIVETPSPRIVKTLRVLPAPCYPIVNQQVHPLSSLVVVSKDAVRNTPFYKHCFFPAEIQLYFPSQPKGEGKSTISKKTISKTDTRSLSIMIMVRENACKSANEVYALDSIAWDGVMGQFAIIPDSLRRVLNLPVPSLIKLETGRLQMRSEPLLIDAHPLQRLQDCELLDISTNLKLLFKSFCNLCDAIISNGRIYSVLVQKRPVDVLVLLRSDVPLVLTSKTADLLKIRVTVSLSSKEVLDIPRPLPAPDSDSVFLSSAREYIGDFTFVREMKKSLMLQLGVTPCRFAEPQFSLLQGEAGSGKTTLMQAICRDLSSQPFYVQCRVIALKEYIGKKAEAVEKRLLEAAQKASLLRPSLLILDDLDVLCRTRSSDESFGPVADHRHQISCAIQNLLHFVAASNEASKFESHCTIGNILVIGTCVDRSSLDQSLASLDRNNLFPITLTMPCLTPISRVQALNKLLRRRLNSFEIPQLKREPAAVILPENVLQHLDEAMLLKITEGYKLPDLANLSLRISMAIEEKCKKHSIWRSASDPWCRRKIRSVTEEKEEAAVDGLPKLALLQELVSEEVVAAAASEYTPLAYKDVPAKDKSESTMQAIGGLRTARRVLQECLCWPSLYPQLFSQCPTAVVAGLLLYGPPGCGKTKLAHHIALQANINFITVKGPELLSKYIGQSEENVRETFSRAANCAPCLLFFDEFDALAPRRGHDSTGVTDRVVNQLLTQLDGAESRDGVWVMAATCRPDLIDPALLRPGRLEKCIYCPLPSVEERVEILSILSSCLELSAPVNWHEIAELTPGFSGADLQSILTTAHIAAIREVMSDALDKGVIVSEESRHQNRVLLEDAGRKDTSNDTSPTQESWSTASSNFQEINKDCDALRSVQVISNADSKLGSQHRNKNSFAGQDISMETKYTDEVRQKKITAMQDGVQPSNKSPTNDEHGYTPDLNRETEDKSNSSGTPKTIQYSRTHDGHPKDKVLVSMSHILSAVREVKPSVSPSERQKYEALHQYFSRSSKPKFSDPSPGKRATLA